jgi:hypothetical protein
MFSFSTNSRAVNTRNDVELISIVPTGCFMNLRQVWMSGCDSHCFISVVLGLFCVRDVFFINMIIIPCFLVSWNHSHGGYVCSGNCVKPWICLTTSQMKMMYRANPFYRHTSWCCSVFIHEKVTIIDVSINFITFSWINTLQHHDVRL